MTSFWVLAVPAFGFRAVVNEHMEGEKRGFALLEALKQDPENVDYQNEYRDLIGDVKWEEPRIFLETGVTSSQEPAPLGPMSQSGTALTIAERGADVVEGTNLARTAWEDSSSVTREQLTSAFGDATMVAGRVLMNRRDYIVQGDGGTLEYIIDGALASMHSRMFVTIAGEEEPRFVLKRAFNYYNPLATNFGQYVYRVVQCVPRNGECSEGDILYTITKDRDGRGFRWKHEEYRVYTGTGGCSRTGHGILNCHQDRQIIYSLLHDDEAQVYSGNIVAIDADGDNGRVMEDGRWLSTRVGLDELEGMRVANVTKVSGPPHQLTSSTTRYLAGGIYGMGLDAARATVWTDGYRLSFEGGGGSVDQLLVSLLVAVQDLTSDIE
jgi:hypothetical protein